jgi:hypothetical protein
MSESLPFRLSAAGRVATWNPGLTRAAHVMLRIRGPDGAPADRRSLNSGRARVLPGERIEAVIPIAD